MRIAWWYLIIAFVTGAICGAIAISVIPSSSCYLFAMAAVVIVAIIGLIFLSNRFQI